MRNNFCVPLIIHYIYPLSSKVCPYKQTAEFQFKAVLLLTFDEPIEVIIMIHDIYSTIQTELKAKCTEQRRSSTLKFFKHDILCYGVNNPDSQKIGRTVVAYLNDQKVGKTSIWDLAELLFQSEYLEESLIACQIVYAQKKNYHRTDFNIFERWVHRYINNWAECDTFCNKVVGEMLFQFPELVPQVKNWSLSDNLWVRRAAAVSFIYPAKKNQFVEDQFDIALILLEDSEDMVQKGYGWMLKVLSSCREQDVFKFVQTYKERMPRTALRYAIEKMPEALRKRAMAR